MARALPVLADRPRTRGDCVDGPRPCPWVSCRYYLAHEEQSCALDVADQGEHTPAEVAAYLGVTRQRVEFIIARVRKRFVRRMGGLQRG
jgi:hypothetical protein